MGAAWGDGRAARPGGPHAPGPGSAALGAGMRAVLGRIGIRWFRGLARWSQGSVGKRVVAVAAQRHPGHRPLLGLVAAPGQLPADRSRGSAASSVALYCRAQPASADAAAATSSSRGTRDRRRRHRDRLSGDRPLVAAFQKGDTLPTRTTRSSRWCSSPETATRSGTGGTRATPDDTWVFPFDKPLPPEDGDNQALAMATKDGGRLRRRVRHGLGRGRRGAQRQRGARLRVVLGLRGRGGRVPGRADHGRRPCRRTPESRGRRELRLLPLHHGRDRQPAGAVGRGEPGEEQLLALGQIWSQLVAFASEITSHTLTEIMDQLEATKAEIVAILGGTSPAQAPPTPAVATATPTEPSGTGDWRHGLSRTDAGSCTDHRSGGHPGWGSGAHRRGDRRPDPGRARDH